MSGKGEALSDSSDSENERKIMAQLRAEQKASKRKSRQAPSGAPQPKKSTPVAAAAKPGSAKEEKIFIGKMKYVTVREFKNKLYVDIREHYEKDGQLMPGKKGVSLPAEQWQNLKSVIDEVDERLRQMS